MLFTSYCAGVDGRPLHYRTRPSDEQFGFGVESGPEVILESFKVRRKKRIVSVITKPLVSTEIPERKKKQDLGEVETSPVEGDAPGMIGHRRGLALSVKVCANRRENRACYRAFKQWIGRPQQESWKRHRQVQWR